MIGWMEGEFERTVHYLLDSRERVKRYSCSEHGRLEKVLVERASTLGCHYPFDLSKRVRIPLVPNSIPDIELWDGTRTIFIGDAKDSENEVVGDQQVAKRIRRYFDAFAACINGHSDVVGHFVMATNSEGAARDWATFLDECARDHGLCDHQRRICRFAIQKLDRRTWVIY